MFVGKRLEGSRAAASRGFGGGLGPSPDSSAPSPPPRPDKGRFPSGSGRAATIGGSGGGLGPPPVHLLPPLPPPRERRFGGEGGPDASSREVRLPRSTRCPPLSAAAAREGAAVPAAPAVRRTNRFRPDAHPCQTAAEGEHLDRERRGRPRSRDDRRAAARQRTPPRVRRRQRGAIDRGRACGPPPVVGSVRWLESVG